MAYGIRRKSNTSISISTTGIAGPSGGSKEKPVGLVWISISASNYIFSKKYIFTGNREQITWQTITSTLNLLEKYLNKI